MAITFVVWSHLDTRPATSTYLTPAEYAALERAAAAQQRTVAELVPVIVLGFLGRRRPQAISPLVQTRRRAGSPFLWLP